MRTYKRLPAASASAPAEQVTQTLSHRGTVATAASTLTSAPPVSSRQSKINALEAELQEKKKATQDVIRSNKEWRQAREADLEKAQESLRQTILNGESKLHDAQEEERAAEEALEAARNAV